MADHLAGHGDGLGDALAARLAAQPELVDRSAELRQALVASLAASLAADPKLLDQLATVHAASPEQLATIVREAGAELADWFDSRRGQATGTREITSATVHGQGEPG